VISLIYVKVKRQISAERGGIMENQDWTRRLDSWTRSTSPWVHGSSPRVHGSGPWTRGLDPWTQLWNGLKQV